ncbi:hypothetical protein ID866_10073, partial [Astraeus odoratus]
MADIAPTTRIVPGAPPAVPSSKSQRKKRKSNKMKAGGSPTEGSLHIPDTSSIPPEQLNDGSDVKDDTGAVEFVAASEAPTNDETLVKPSPVIELVQKRMRALNKKISRIAGYASTDYEKLNDDQKRSLKMLSTLEAVQKELDDVKKAIEASELETAGISVECVDKLDVSDVNGLHEQEPDVIVNPSEIQATSTQPIDWAEADEEGLPSIANLQATLVSSDSACIVFGPMAIGEGEMNIVAVPAVALEVVHDMENVVE